MKVPFVGEDGGARIVVSPKNSDALAKAINTILDEILISPPQKLPQKFLWYQSLRTFPWTFW